MHTDGNTNIANCLCLYVLVLKDELERALRYNTEIKERLNREHGTTLELSATIKDLQKELTASRENASDLSVKLEQSEAALAASRQSVAGLEAELVNAQTLMEQAGTMEKHKSENHKAALEEKDALIAEVGSTFYGDLFPNLTSFSLPFPTVACKDRRRRGGGADSLRKARGRSSKAG
jgi:septal ring factor EnvC (AmiA/AmiB activator)